MDRPSGLRSLKFTFGLSHCPLLNLPPRKGQQPACPFDIDCKPVYINKCCSLVEMSENPLMTFPIKKRINTELFIDEWAGLYIQNVSQTF